MSARVAKEELLKRYIASPGHILVTGKAAVGKTSLVLKIFQQKEVFNGAYAYINCHEIATPSCIYRGIVQQLEKNRRKTRDNSQEETLRQTEIDKFVAKIVTAHKHHASLCIILDQVEQFKWSNLFDTLKIFNAVPEIKLLMISNETAAEILNYIKQPAIRMMIHNKLNVLEVDPWTIPEIVSFISSDRPKTDWKDTYDRFVNNMIIYLYSNTRNIHELRRICQTNYCDFLDVLFKVLERLYEKQKKYRTKQLTREYLMDFEFSTHHIMEAFHLFIKDFKQKRWADSDLLRGVKVDTSVSYYMTFMIAAAYIAAYTTSRDDKRNFITYQHRKTSRARDTNALERKSQPFTLERLLQIYQRLTLLQGKFTSIDDKSADQDDLETREEEKLRALKKLPEIYNTVLYYVELLENPGLIRQVSGDGLDATTRYRVSDQLTKEYVQRLLDQIQVSLSDISGL